VKISAEDMALERPDHFDIVTCFAVLEHVPDPASTVRACSQALKPGGHAFFATLNRNPKSFLLAILGAEYVLGLLPRGTHEYAKFIKPSELAACCREAGLAVVDLTGMTYSPLTRTFALGRDTDVNYILHATAP
jgi:2-polyprenyl-6-hydroxyphenyl methylase/3-demethylubiquinone-9 3-methyltransferase